MIIGPILLVVFLIAFAITFAITKEVFKSLGIAGAIAAVPIGAFLGGFWGAVFAAALGAAYGLGLPFLAATAIFIGVVSLGVYGFVYGLEGIGKLFGLDFGDTMSGFIALFWITWFVAMLLGSPVSHKDPETLWDKLRRRIRGGRIRELQKRARDLEYHLGSPPSGRCAICGRDDAESWINLEKKQTDPGPLEWIHPRCLTLASRRDYHLELNGGDERAAEMSLEKDSRDGTIDELVSWLIGDAKSGRGLRWR